VRAAQRQAGVQIYKTAAGRQAEKPQAHGENGIWFKSEGAEPGNQKRQAVYAYPAGMASRYYAEPREAVKQNAPRPGGGGTGYNAACHA